MPNTCEIGMRDHLSDFLITLRGNHFEMSPFLDFKTLGVFVNTLTAKDMYPVGNRENLQFVIQMQLS